MGVVGTTLECCITDDVSTGFWMMCMDDGGSCCCEMKLLHGCQIAKFDPFLSSDCARVECVGAQSKERKGSNFAAQRSGAIVKKPEGPNMNDPKIRL